MDDATDNDKLTNSQKLLSHILHRYNEGDPINIHRSQNHRQCLESRYLHT